MAKNRSPHVQEWIDFQLETHGDYREMLARVDYIEGEIEEARSLWRKAMNAAGRGDKRAEAEAQRLSTFIVTLEEMMQGDRGSIQKEKRFPRRHAVRIVS